MTVASTGVLSLAKSVAALLQEAETDLVAPEVMSSTQSRVSSPGLAAINLEGVTLNSVKKKKKYKCCLCPRFSACTHALPLDL